MLKPDLIIYLHGLGGSPQSAKGVLIASHFGPLGIATQQLRLSIPSLAELSPIEAIEHVAAQLREASPRSVALVASSFGAYIGLHAMWRLAQEERAHVTRLVLLAPLINPWDSSSSLLTTEAEAEWARRKRFPVRDLESGELVDVHYGLVEELKSLGPAPVCPTIPALVVHGRRDAVVSPSQSEGFCKIHPTARLELLDEDHSLLGDRPKLLGIIEEFLLGPGSVPAGGR